MNLEQLAELARRQIDPQATVTPVATAGLETLAARLDLAGSSACLRVGRAEAFAKDAWAHRTFAELMPVPAVLACGTTDDGQAWAITEWVSGPTLQDLDAEQVAQTMPAVFEVWEALQQAPHAHWQGVGPVDPVSLHAPGDSLAAQFHELAARAQSWPLDWVTPRQAEVDHLVASFTRLIPALPECRDVTHGDFGTNNLIVHPGRVVAVLDWDCAGIGDRLADLAGRHWQFWPAVRDCLGVQAEFAEGRLGDEPGFALRRLAHDLSTSIEEITGCLAEGDSEFAQAHLHRSLELLAQDRSVLAELTRRSPGPQSAR